MISIDNLKVEFGVKPLFDNVSFVINDKDRIALVGKNGAGKSTMLKIICGLQKPTSGNVAIPNDTTIGYLPQVMNLQDNTTVREEVKKAFADISKMKERVDKLNEELAQRTDYDSDSYMELVQKFTTEHERYMMMGADNYEAEMERTLTGLGFERTDFDRLVLDVETKPSIAPRDAVASAGKTLVELFGLARDLNVEAEGIEIGVAATDETLAADLALPIESLNLQSRSYNALRRRGILTVGELVAHSEADLLDIRNFGTKSIEEIKESLATLGMALKDSPLPGEGGESGESIFSDDLGL